MNQPVPPLSVCSGDPRDPARVLVAAYAARSRVAEGESGASVDAALRDLFGQLGSRGIRHVLVGGLALIQYVPVRNTDDVGVIVAVEDVPRIAGMVIVERNDWFAAARFGNLAVDLLFTVNPLFKHVAESHVETRILMDLPVSCANPTGLLLLKLFALPSLYRQGNIPRADLFETDITMLMRQYPHDPEALLQTLSSHMSATDVNALRKVLDEVVHRITRTRHF